MIHLFMNALSHNMTEPVKLVIENRTYEYKKDEMFTKLKEYEGYKIRVSYSGTRTDTKVLIIKRVDLNGEIPTIELE